MPKIGVEESLTAVQSELRERGYDVVKLRNENDAKGCDCCVVTGQDSNMMGIQNAVTPGSVINASGKSADQVCQEVENKIR